MLNTSVHLLFLIFVGILSVIILLIAAVVMYSFLEHRKTVRLAVWSDMINHKISEAIVSDHGERMDDDRTEWAGNHSFRNFFLQKLVESEQKFSGAADEKIKILFRSFGLQREALKKLAKKKTHFITGGIQELTAMNYLEALPDIALLLKHPSAQVYQEAQYAMVAFKGFEGLEFLDETAGRISEWQQLRLLRSVSHIPENSEDILKKWLESNNDSVVIFTLKLIRKFQMLSLYDMMATLLHHKSREVKVQLVQTLFALENSSTILHLTDSYVYQETEVQTEILKILKISRDRNSTDFLKRELVRHPDLGIKVHAAETLSALGEQRYLSELSQDLSSSEELVQITQYALQQKIW